MNARTCTVVAALLAVLLDARATIAASSCIDVLGNDLRQVTHFEDTRPLAGCTFVPGGACTLTSTPRADPVTGTIVFAANCDPFGTNPFGDQLFAVRPDGGGLRQLTSLGGMRQLADGTLTVELAGPFAYSAPLP